jgi:hypothetical protein
MEPGVLISPIIVSKWSVIRTSRVTSFGGFGKRDKGCIASCSFQNYIMVKIPKSSFHEEASDKDSDLTAV